MYYLNEENIRDIVTKVVKKALCEITETDKYSTGVKSLMRNWSGSIGNSPEWCQ